MALPSDIPLPTARLLGGLIASLLFGFFCALFCAAVYFLVFDRRGSQLNVRLLTTLVMLFALAATHLGLILAEIFEAFTGHHGQSADQYFHTLPHPLENASTGMLVFDMVIGDCFLIYRSYTVWGRKRMVIICPIMTLVGSVVCGCYLLAAAINRPPGLAKSVVVTSPWLTALGATTLATNGLCSGLIAFKIIQTRKLLQGTTTSFSKEALIITIESAALYFASWVVYIILYKLELNVQFIVAESATSLFGISFAAIIIRISLRLSTVGGLPTSDAPLTSLRFVTTDITSVGREELEDDDAAHGGRHTADIHLRSTGTRSKDRPKDTIEQEGPGVTKFSRASTL